MGVDVFFVISGFLITSVIDREIAAGTFSVRHFYERRVRRIFPALFLLLPLTLLVALLLMLPQDRKLVVASATAATLFVSNVVFWTRAGYFDRSSEADPLLHTWSLGVEEQFYLLFPLLLLWLSRRLPRQRVAILAALAAASLAGSAWSASRAADAGFFLLPTRLWELLLGALFALGAFALPVAVAGLASVVGLLLIGFAITTFSSLTPFPGVAALAPCVGTLLVIAAGSGQLPAANRALSWRPLVFVGLISYSLYLWHWPVLVLARYYAFPLLLRDPRPAELAALALLPVLLAALSWRFVERPFRDRARVADPLVLRSGACAMIATCALAALVAFVPGLPERIVPSLATPAPLVRELYPCLNRSDARLRREGLCAIGAAADDGAPFVLWGDSHANALVPALDLAGQRAGRRGAYATRGGCLPVLGVETEGTANCRGAWDASFVELLRQRGFKTIVLGMRWNLYAGSRGFGFGADGGLRVFLRDERTAEVSAEENRRVIAEGLPRTVQLLKRRGLRVVLVGPVPEVGRSVPATQAKLQLLGRARAFGPLRQEFEERSRFVLDLIRDVAASEDLEVVYPHERLCPAAGRCVTTSGEEALYEDDDHLSVFGARALADLFVPILNPRR